MLGGGREARGWQLRGKGRTGYWEGRWTGYLLGSLEFWGQFREGKQVMNEREKVWLMEAG